MDPVVVGALGELIATAIATAAGRSWRAIQSSPEAVAVQDAVNRALVVALLDARQDTVTADDDWVREVAEVWKSAFTPAVARALVGCLARPGEGDDEFATMAAEALGDSGCDLVELSRTFWVEQFLCLLPRLMFKELEDAALGSDAAVRSLVGHLLEQRAEARTGRIEYSATPREFGEDLLLLLRRLDSAARTRRLPPYLPRGSDVSRLARTVRTRRGIRASPRLSAPVLEVAERAYQLPVEYAEDNVVREPTRPWPEVAANHRRLVVLADPGLGKSWLIRTETHRLCEQALAAADAGREPTALLIPVPMRCDELAAAPGRNLAQAIAAFLAAQRLLPARSQVGFQALAEAGRIVLLLDALDELTTDEEYGRVREFLLDWHEQAGDAVRCVVTSRIAGYRGSPLPDASEVELQAFTPEDVSAAVEAWRLPPPVASRVLDRVKSPAMAGMTRVPLLLALLCSLAAELPEGDHLPTTRAELYDRMLRWFLTGAHRADERPAHPELAAEKVDALLDILAPVAFHFASLSDGWADLMPPAQLRNAIRLAGVAFTERGRSASDIVQELSVAAGILVPAGNPSAGRHLSYLFMHRTFAEYLVARHLSTMPVADWLQVVDQHMWFDPDWAEVIPLLGAQLGSDDALRLTRHLLGQANDPFHHALLAAARVMAEQPDPDHHLPPEELRTLVETIRGLIIHPASSEAAFAVLAGASQLPRRLTDDLLALLTDDNWPVANAAMSAIAGRNAPEITHRLLLLLDETRWSTMRVAAVEALGGRDTPEVTRRLMEMLIEERGQVQDAVAKALARRNAPGLTDQLVGLLDDPVPAVRVAAVEALAGQETPEVTRRLVELLDDTHWPVVREAAVKALAGRGAPEVTRRLLRQLDDPDGGVWAAAVDALAGREAPELTDRLLAALDYPDRQMRRKAVQVLAGREAPGIAERLLAQLCKHDWTVAEEVAEALAGRETPEVTVRLVELLDDQDEWVRIVAVKVLAGRDAPGLTDRLLALLDAKEDPVRRAAVTALAGRDAPGLTDRLLALLHDNTGSMRIAAMDALAGRKSPEISDALLELFGDEDEIARTYARQVLEGRDAPGLTDRLLALLDDPAPTVRLSAAEALMARNEVRDLLALVGRVRVLTPAVLGYAYQIAQHMVTRVYLRLPEESRASVRVDLAWLTMAVLARDDLDLMDGVPRVRRSR